MRPGTVRLFLSLLAVAAAALLSVSCASIAPEAVEEPLRVTRFAAGASGSRPLVVFLPGRWDSAGDFRRQGLLRALEQAGWSAEVWAVDLEVRHFRDGRVAERLQHDVLAAIPPDRLFCTFLLGISMGGLAAILADQATPAPWNLVLLSPYIGELPRDVPGPDGGSQPRWEERIFREVERWAADRPLTARVWLGFGSGDRLAPQQRWLAAHLPADQVAEVAGGHDWPTWRRLFALLLQRIPRDSWGVSGLKGR